MVKLTRTFTFGAQSRSVQVRVGLAEAMASASHHSWEDPSRGKTHTWERRDRGDDDSDDENSPDFAAKEFMTILRQLYLVSQISAESFSVLCFWAAKAGMCGDAREFGKAPGLESGNYKKHLDARFAFTEDKHKN